MQASTQLRNSSPRPVRRSSYQRQASVRSCSASGATTSVAVTVTTDVLFDFFPRESGGWASHQVGLSAGQLRLLPFMNRNRFGSGRKVIPQVFHELELFRRTQLEDRGMFRMHLKPSPSDSRWLSAPKGVWGGVMNESKPEREAGVCRRAEHTSAMATVTMRRRWRVPPDVSPRTAAARRCCIHPPASTARAHRHACRRPP